MLTVVESRLEKGDTPSEKVPVYCGEGHGRKGKDL